MKRLNDFIEKVFLILGVFLLSVFILAVFLQVVARNYLHLPFIWTDEVAVMSFIWSVFLGAAVAVRRKRHYTVELFPPHWKRVNTILDTVSDLACLFFMYVMITYGYTFTYMGLSRFSTAVGIPKAYFFLAIPVAGVAMFIFSIELIYRDIRQLWYTLRGGKE